MQYVEIKNLDLFHKDLVQSSKTWKKNNDIINKFLLVGDKFNPNLVNILLVVHLQSMKKELRFYAGW